MSELLPEISARAAAMSDRWKVYKCRDGYWAGEWIVQPPGASFDESYGFAGPRGYDRAINYAHDQASMERS